MMGHQPKKRPWFQLHLSTCVVLMVVAGWLVWANLDSRPEVGDHGGRYEVYGWPYDVYILELGDRPYGYMREEWVADAGIALAILLLTAVACEYGIRRRERKQ